MREDASLSSGYGPPAAPPPGGVGGGFGAGSGGYGPPGEPPNPYAPPGGDGFGRRPGSGPLEPLEAMSFAWSWMVQDFAAVALPLAVAFLAITVPAFLLSAASNVIQALAGNANGTALKLVVSLAGFAVDIVAQAYMLGGMTRFALAIARGQKPEFGLIFQGGPYFKAFAIGQALLTVGMTLGFALCLVPGVLLWIGSQFYACLVVERGLSPLDALSESFRLVQGQWGNLFVLGLLQLASALLGLALCCVGAYLLTVPLWCISTAYAYLKLTGEAPVPTNAA